jgi:hypothetical protein
MIARSSATALRAEFEAAVAEELSQAEAGVRMPQGFPIGWRSPACVFGAKHGNRPIRLYREFATKYCVSSSLGEARMGVAALDALSC